MDPEKRKRNRRRHQEWLENDPLNRKLRERIAHHRAKIVEEQEANARREARPFFLRWLPLR